MVKPPVRTHISNLFRGSISTSQKLIQNHQYPTHVSFERTQYGNNDYLSNISTIHYIFLQWTQYMQLLNPSSTPRHLGTRWDSTFIKKNKIKNKKNSFQLLDFEENDLYKPKGDDLTYFIMRNTNLNDLVMATLINNDCHTLILKHFFSWALNDEMMSYMLQENRQCQHTRNQLTTITSVDRYSTEHPQGLVDPPTKNDKTKSAHYFISNIYSFSSNGI